MRLLQRADRKQRYRGTQASGPLGPRNEDRWWSPAKRHV